MKEEAEIKAYFWDGMTVFQRYQKVIAIYMPPAYSTCGIVPKIMSKLYGHKRHT